MRDTNLPVWRSQWPKAAGAWGPILAVGVLVGVDNAIFSVAIGALLFSGQLAGGVGLAIAASILSSFIISLTLAFFSQIKGNVGHVQDVGVAVLAQALAVGVASQAMPEETRIATALIIVALSTLASGVLLWGTGALGWGRVVRFFPQSVLAGFLAGTGWLLAAGGLSVATGIALSQLFHTSAWTERAVQNALPAVAFGLILMLVQRRVAWKGVLLTFMLAGIGGFHLLLWLKGISIAQAQAFGWLPHINTNVAGVPNLAQLAALADWGIVAKALPAVATVAFLTLIGTLLNTAALTSLSNADADADRELRLHGVANLAIATVGGPPGHIGIASSQIVLRAGVTLRGVGLVAAAVALFGLFNVSTLVAVLPHYVTAGLIIYLGIDFLYDWLILTQRSYGRGEWSVVAVILAIVIGVGFAQAIVAGLLIASLIFAWNYASVPVLRHTASLRERSSTLTRPPAETAWLRDQGDQVEVVELQGFMFFGTADRLYDHIRRRINDKSRPALSHLIIDFQHVVGLDAAAAAQLLRVVTLCKQQEVTLALSGYPHNVLVTLTRAAPALLTKGGALNLPSLDEALEQAEDKVLAQAPEVSAPTMLQRLAPDPADLPHLERLFASLPRESFANGTVILASGSLADSLIFLESGRVVIRAPSEAGTGPRWRAMSSGAVLGDIGLALNATRTANVIADTDIVLRRLTLAAMQRFETEDPALSHALLRLQCRSLAEKIVFDERLAKRPA